jgi:tRNA 2-thiouridine synthesizing protein A
VLQATLERRVAGSRLSPDESEEALDLTGLKCPLPALMTRRRLAALPAGAMLTVIADDPMAAIDVPHMCRTEGYEVLEVVRDGDVARFVLRRP